MADPDASPEDGGEVAESEESSERVGGGEAEGEGEAESEEEAEALTTEELRARVEERYDFENFGPTDMEEMEAEEWEAVFDPDAWITGEELVDRVEADLKRRVLDRDVFARVERFGDVVVAYDENDYAAVYPDGTVRGRGTVLRDVEPTVALCSMDTYEPPSAPDVDVLPEPDEIPESSDTIGNTLLQVLGGVQVLAGLGLLAAYVLYLLDVLSLPAGQGGVNLILMVVAGVGFLLVGIFLFVVVANARLSDRVRSEAYRDRLRSVGLADGERPAFLAEIEGVEGLPTEADAGGERGGAGETGPRGRD